MSGFIHGFYGPMFSEKTTRLLAELNKAERRPRTRVVLFKPEKDDRFGAGSVQTHAGGARPAASVSGTEVSLEVVMNLSTPRGDEVVVAGFDEVQFFPPQIVDVFLGLRRCGVRVFCSGLDMDSNGEPFGFVPTLMAIGGVTKCTAVCTRCGEDATHTFRKVPGGGQVLVGGGDLYEPLCFGCWEAAGAFG